MTNNKPDVKEQAPPDRKIIFVAELIDNKNVQIRIFSKYLPILAHAQKLLGIEIDKLYIDERMNGMNEQKIKPAHSILDFVRRRK